MGVGCGGKGGCDGGWCSVVMGGSSAGWRWCCVGLVVAVLV